tara:strand:+ start:428 stop:1552 length:1125 start_codon:yes stop_codon:yes gene_type:complete
MKNYNLIHKILIFSIPFEFSNFFNFGFDFLIFKIISSLYIISTFLIFGNKIYNVIRKHLQIIFLFLVVIFLHIFSEFQYSGNLFGETSNLIFLQNYILFFCYIVHIEFDNVNFTSNLKYFIYSFFCVIILSFIGFESEALSLDDRLTVLNFNQNLLGNYLVLFLFLVFNNSNYKPFFKLLISLLTIYLIIRTGSRQAFLLLCLTVFIYYYFNKKTSPFLKLMFFIPVIFFSISISGIFVNNTQIGKRINNALKSGDTSGRDILISTYPTLLKERELILGIGSTEFKKRAIRKIGRYTSSHNMFLDQFIKTGYLGLLLILFITFIIYSKATNKFKEKGSFEFTFFLSFFLLTSMVGHPLGTRMIWVGLAYIIAKK